MRTNKEIHMEETQHRLNIIVSDEELNLVSAIAEREKTTITDVLMQGLNCLARQKGMKPLPKRDTRNLFFKKGELLLMLVEILKDLGKPNNLNTILDEIKVRKALVLDVERQTRLRSSIGVTLSREAKAGKVIVEAYKEGGETYWKLPTEAG